MNNEKASQIIDAIKRSGPPKKRVTFFVTIKAKQALADWCKKNGVPESSAIEEMIKATVPGRYFKSGKAR